MSYDSAVRIAAAGEIVATKNQTVKLINSYNKALEEAGLPTVFDVIQKAHESELEGNWKLVANDTVSNVEMFKNNNNVFKIKIDGVNKTVVIFAKQWLRILAYPATGSNTDLFLVSDKLYILVLTEM